MNILVTGGAGYIGSHVCNLLSEQGHCVSIIDNLSNIKSGTNPIIFGKHYNKDISDLKFIDELMSSKKFDACIHFAALTIVYQSVEKPLNYYKNNTENSFNLIKLCLKYNINKFIFSSTAAVYGTPIDRICHEESPVNPINPYGKSKLITEWFLEDIAKKSSLNHITLRYFNVAGANMKGKSGQYTKESTHLIKVVSECATGKREYMNIFGNNYDTEDGTCIRDYIHVDDLAYAHIDALNYLNKNNISHTLNCGYGHGYSVKEVIDTAKKISPKKFEVKIAEKRKGDPPCLIAKAEKIKEILKWSPKYNDLELIIKTAIKWESK